MIPSNRLPKSFLMAMALLLTFGMEHAGALTIPTGEFIVNGGFGSSASTSIAGWDTGGTVNPRSANNTIDNSGGSAGFNNFFGPGTTGSTNAFAVLGDDTGAIGNDPNSGIHSISQSFILPTVLDGSSIRNYDLTISLRSAFDGRDSVDPSTVHDILSARIFSDILDITLFNQNSSPFPSAAPGTGQPNNQLVNDPLLSSILGLQPGGYTLWIELNEGTATSGNNFTNTAAGIDDVSVTGQAHAMVPEPGTFLLLGGGLLGLGLLKRFRRRS